VIRAVLWTVVLTLVIVFSVAGWIGQRIAATTGGYVFGLIAAAAYVSYWRWRWTRRDE